jgi:hypothetical protein
MSPPNVKGWPGGETWINTTTLLARKAFVDRLTRADGTSSGTMAMSPSAGAAGKAVERGLSGLAFDSAGFLAQFPGATADERARWAERLLLPLAPQSSGAGADSLALVRGYLLDTAYQLK